eukprot:GSMAST32.ASY1.ANO1.807.1 assembled CDS
MVQFAKKLNETLDQEWKDKYLDYKSLKKRIKAIVLCQKDGNSSFTEIKQRIFVTQLELELSKIIVFHSKQEAEIQEEGIAFLDLCDRVKTSRQLLNQYNKLGQQIVRLLKYVELNLTGLRKILKKHDKKISTNPITTEFLQSYQSGYRRESIEGLQYNSILTDLVSKMSGTMKNLRAANLISATTCSSDEAEITVMIGTLLKDVNKHHFRAKEAGSWMDLANLDVLSVIASDSNYDTYNNSSDDSVDVDWSSTSSDSQESGTSLLCLKPCLRQEKGKINIVYSKNSLIIKNYASALHNPGFGIVAFGAMPAASLLVAIPYRYRAERIFNGSFKNTFIFSVVLLIFGNLMYALASYFGYVWMLVCGRILCGLGCSGSLSRRYISSFVPRRQRTYASAIFVAAGSVGLFLGPMLAGFIITYHTEINIPVMKFAGHPVPGYLLACMWTILLIFIIMKFEDIDTNSHESNAIRPVSTASYGLLKGNKVNNYNSLSNCDLDSKKCDTIELSKNMDKISNIRQMKNVEDIRFDVTENTNTSKDDFSNNNQFIGKTRRQYRSENITHNDSLIRVMYGIPYCLILVFILHVRFHFNFEVVFFVRNSVPND